MARLVASRATTRAPAPGARRRDEALFARGIVSWLAEIVIENGGVVTPALSDKHTRCSCEIKSDRLLGLDNAGVLRQWRLVARTVAARRRMLPGEN